MATPQPNKNFTAAQFFSIVLVAAALYGFSQLKNSNNGFDLSFGLGHFLNASQKVSLNQSASFGDQYTQATQQLCANDTAGIYGCAPQPAPSGSVAGASTVAAPVEPRGPNNQISPRGP
jgi:hypothetical protein